MHEGLMGAIASLVLVVLSGVLLVIASVCVRPDRHLSF